MQKLRGDLDTNATKLRDLHKNRDAKAFFGLTEGSERAFVADLVPERLRGRAYGFFHGAIGVAALPASVLFGMIWKRFGPQAAFLTGAGIALAATVALWAATAKRGQS